MGAEDSSGAARAGAWSLSGGSGRVKDRNVGFGLGSWRVEGGRVAIVVVWLVAVIFLWPFIFLDFLFFF